MHNQLDFICAVVLLDERETEHRCQSKNLSAHFSKLNIARRYSQWRRYTAKTLEITQHKPEPSSNQANLVPVVSSAVHHAQLPRSPLAHTVAPVPSMLADPEPCSFMLARHSFAQ